MGDYGYVSVMPQVGELKLLPKERALTFSHKDEVTRPYYYSVLLDAPGNQKIKTEIAAASRAPIFQFTFPATEKAHLIIQGINLNPELKDPSNDYEDRIRKLKGYIKIHNHKTKITPYNPDRISPPLAPKLPNFKAYF